MTQVKKGCIELTFNLESDATLWNVVFKGFDEEVVLISKFEGKHLFAVKVLRRFGAVLAKQYKDCQIEIRGSSLVIRKTLPTNDAALIRNWENLMYSIREEMASFIDSELNP